MMAEGVAPVVTEGVDTMAEGLGTGVADRGPQRAGGPVEFVQGPAVAGDPGEGGGGVAQPDGAAGADVDDALRGGERGGVHRSRDVPDVDEVPLGAQAAEPEFAVAGLHGAAHGLGEPAQRGAGGRTGPRGREDPQDDGVQTGAEDEFGRGELADAVGTAGAGTASSAVEEPGWLGPYSALQPTCTRRAPQPLRRRASQTVATATVLCRVSSRAPPRVAPAQLTTTPGWTASRKRVRAPGLPVARSKRTSASSPRPRAVSWTAGSASRRSATKRPM